jgi:flagellar biosynthesis/type III secretory pathway protein FliH
MTGGYGELDMTLSKGRVVPAAALDGRAEPVKLGLRPALPRGRVVPAKLLEADERAQAILARAEEQAALMIEAARRESADVRLRSIAEGRAEGVAAVAAKALALAAREAEFDEHNLDRLVELARLLAERLLGEALAIDPARVAALARAALAEARGARRAVIAAHPDDAAELGPRLGELGFDARAISLRPDPSRERGSVRVETEIGVLDADLAPQLARLAAKLRERLKP